MSRDAFGLLAAMSATVYLAFERYRQTTHGQNPWTLDGAFGVLSIAMPVERIVAGLGAALTSVYRSPQVMRAVYESKKSNAKAWSVVTLLASRRGMSTDAYVEQIVNTSRHLRGLAADFVPKNMAVPDAAKLIHTSAMQGELGAVKLVLAEGDHVHVEWWAPWENAQRVPPRLEAV